MIRQNWRCLNNQSYSFMLSYQIFWVFIQIEYELVIYILSSNCLMMHAPRNLDFHTTSIVFLPSIWWFVLVLSFIFFPSFSFAKQPSSFFPIYRLFTHLIFIAFHPLILFKCFFNAFPLQSFSCFGHHKSHARSDELSQPRGNLIW